MHSTLGPLSQQGRCELSPISHVNKVGVHPALQSPVQGCLACLACCSCSLPIGMCQVAVFFEGGELKPLDSMFIVTHAILG